MDPISAVAILIGLPPPVRPFIERRVGPHISVKSIPLSGFMLEPPPLTAVQMIEHFADGAPSYERVLVVVLPYTSGHLPTEVAQSLSVLADLGATICRPQSGTGLWPARSPRLDNQFQTDLAKALGQLINSTFPEDPLSDAHHAVCKELLRGLATHSKMGPNNHSHEDDLWKSRGQDLGPGEREVIVSRMLREGLLGRKKNKSAGGTGWVYWIADVQLTRTRYPELDPYFQ